MNNTNMYVVFSSNDNRDKEIKINTCLSEYTRFAPYFHSLEEATHGVISIYLSYINSFPHYDSFLFIVRVDENDLIQEIFNLPSKDEFLLFT